MTAEEIFKKHRIKQMVGNKTISDLDTILNAMKEYGKLIHKNTRYKAVDIYNDGCPEGQDVDRAIMNMKFEDIEPK